MITTVLTMMSLTSTSIETSNNVVVPESIVQLSSQQLHMLAAQTGRTPENVNFAVDRYLVASTMIEEFFSEH